MEILSGPGALFDGIAIINLCNSKDVTGLKQKRLPVTSTRAWPDSSFGIQLSTEGTVLCKSNESEFRRNSSFVLTNFQRNFEQYFAIFRKFEALSKKLRVINRKVAKANEISMKRRFEGAKYRRIFAEEIEPQDKHLHA